MSDTLRRTPELPTIAGGRVIARIRRMLVVTTLIAIVYMSTLGGSKSQCLGGMDANGNYLNADGAVTQTAPQCVTVTLANPMLLLLFVAAVVWAISRVLRSHQSETAAIALLDRVQKVIGIATVAAVVISNVWFWFGVPLESLQGDSYFVLSPFPFGQIEVQRAPMVFND